MALVTTRATGSPGRLTAARRPRAIGHDAAFRRHDAHRKHAGLAAIPDADNQPDAAFRRFLVLYRGAGLSIVWPQLIAVAPIGSVYFAFSLPPRDLLEAERKSPIATSSAGMIPRPPTATGPMRRERHPASDPARPRSRPSSPDCRDRSRPRWSAGVGQAISFCFRCPRRPAGAP
jgi:hypothetical protein